MFVDTAKVSLKAGKGGDGAVSFRHEIYIPKGGPDGGDGGRGGSIIFKADKDTNTLLDFRYNPILTAENGKNGAGQRAAGRSGKDLIVEVPIGTMVWKLTGLAKATTEEEFTSQQGGWLAWGDLPPSEEGGTTEGTPTHADDEVIEYGGDTSRDRPPAREQKENARQAPRSGTDEDTSRDRVPAREQPRRILLADLTADGQTAIIARGGDGGFGNAHFKSSTRQTPTIAEVGEPGEEFEVELELKLLADVGLVGLPNAGKSTFLSVVTNARPEIANYPFTTITPNLGVATIDGQDLLIADIPGLIEGASEGKGLGHAFLRHVDRTAVLLHLIDAYADDAGKAYATIRGELEKYSDLKERSEIIALTKTEGLDPDIIKMQEQSILKHNPQAQIFAISAQAHLGLKDLLHALRDAVAKSAEAAGRGAENLSSPVASSSNLGSSNGVTAVEGGPGGTQGQRPEYAGEGKRLAGPHYEGEGRTPIITLSSKQLKNAWQVSRDGSIYVVTGEKIEKFARRTDLSNYASVNRLRDIMKKLGIRAELTTQGAGPDSIIRIADKEFTLVEQLDEK